MIIEGFEIESWACIKKAAVADLPPSGVIVLHGQNRTGKSSLVQALRACLMDYSSTSTALKARYPRGSGEKPVVSVTYRSAGATYRIKKWFGSSKSEFATRTPGGAWRVETTSAADAHARVCEHAGGDDSGKGLRQLLWLTQAEFRLPEPKKFDADVQAQLRGILGVLQTKLDDQFLGRVKDRWNAGYSGQRKTGKQHKLKEGSRLAQDLNRLNEARAELDQLEFRFGEVEGLLRQTSGLEARRVDLVRQLEAQSRELRDRQGERERSQARIAARKLAEERHSHAAKEQRGAIEESGRRHAAAHRLDVALGAVQPARDRLDAAEEEFRVIVAEQAERRSALVERKEALRTLQRRAKRASAKLRAIDDSENLGVAKRDLHRVQEIGREAAAIKEYLAENPAADPPTLRALKANREQASRRQADRDAASMTLSVMPEDGAGPARLTLDDAPSRPLAGTPLHKAYPVHRRAELHIPSWGRVELRRGTSGGDLDQIEAELQRCQGEFSEILISLGIAPSDPDAFDQLLRRNAEHQIKGTELARLDGELRKLAPKGPEPLQRRVSELEAKLKDGAPSELEESASLPDAREELEGLKNRLEAEIALHEKEVAGLEAAAEAVAAKLERGRAGVTRAREEMAGVAATADGRREELGRLRTGEQIALRVDQAKQGLASSQVELDRSELTPEEETIEERLAACGEAVRAIEKQIRENEETSNRIRGRLEGSEGLHARRAALGARVDELTRRTQREQLELDAVDRLYELFEECREKQLGALLGPIHDRVLNWMRVLDIGDYREVRFNDAFLPENLVRRDGTAEFRIDEESTGAQEQIGMLVRLALGSLLTGVDEPAVAILDDPLTHCDVGRLNKMRVILRRIAEGDSTLDPPSGPLQLFILTCHPEWFRDERATVIDLEDPEVMHRFAV